MLIIFVSSSYSQEGAELEEENNNNEDLPDAIEGEGDEKQEQELVERPRKTSKYMTKYERARILGTRALQIRFVFCWPFRSCSCASLCDNLVGCDLGCVLWQHECSGDGGVGGRNRSVGGEKFDNIYEL